MRLAIVAWLLAASSCTRAPPAPAPAALPAVPHGAEATSLLGAPLSPPAIEADERAKRERALDEARAAYERAPGDVEAAIWYGRRLGYLHRYRDAVVAFTEAIARHAGDARLFRHRGHRFITLRLLDRAIADLEHAARLRANRRDEIEPDGLPNAANVPTSTLHDNIWYHLGLARYLRGELAAAEQAYREGMRIAANDDMRVATGYWLYLTLRRRGRDADAARLLAELPAAPVLLENHAYHALLRLFRGELAPEALVGPTATALDRHTIGYGVAMWRLLRGEAGPAREALRATAAGQWPSFGAIAAEATLLELQRR